MAIKKLGVLGAGTMGAGIAQVGAQSGLQVILVDLEQAFVDKAIKGMIKNWDKDLSKGKITD
ncbi:MAG TPA: 3-hydroxybutyryl-CoA dehydrogenase, partial [Syntrophomonas wolfei]|nr:3-hydroxybutyryl-CoA dehydrogenase [Syntrophomonas wolfei]